MNPHTTATNRRWCSARAATRSSARPRGARPSSPRCVPRLPPPPLSPPFLPILSVNLSIYLSIYLSISFPLSISLLCCCCASISSRVRPFPLSLPCAAGAGLGWAAALFFHLHSSIYPNVCLSRTRIRMSGTYLQLPLTNNSITTTITITGLLVPQEARELKSVSQAVRVKSRRRRRRRHGWDKGGREGGALVCRF